jgi:hypothetical protein
MSMIGKAHALTIVAVALTLEVCSSAQALGPCPDYTGQCLRGSTSTNAAADRNRCAPNVVRQFRNVKDRGEIMGFHDGGPSIGYPSLNDGSSHWQGVQRLAFPNDRRILLVLTSSHENGWGHYAIVGLGSRINGGFTGRRFGGNRMGPTTQDWNMEPPGNDTISQRGEIHPVFNHPGGPQTIGQFVAVPLEQVGDNDRPGRTQLFDAGVTFSFDVKRCTTVTSGCMRSRWVFEHSEFANGATGLVKLDDGRYLMISGITKEMTKLELNVSRLRPNGALYRIDEPGVFGLSNCPGCSGAYSAKFAVSTIPSWRGYQSLQLVSECGTGHLYLVGNAKDNGEDWLDLFRLNLRPMGVNHEGEPILSTAAPSRAFQYVTSKHFWCRYRDSARQCDFDAAVGIYIDPLGTLLVYATVHDDSAPPPSGVTPPPSGVTRFVEFAPNDPIDNPSTAAIERCDTADKMWVELSNGMLSAGLPPAGSERFFIEYSNVSRSTADFGTAYDFHDQARSIRYCLPQGYRYKLCEHSSFGGTCRFFCGSSVAGCSGSISNGAIRGLNLPAANASSGCFATTTSSTCL